MYDTKCSLSPLRRRLVEEMQCMNFGRIEELAVRDGDPVLDPSPRIVREFKLGGEQRAPSEDSPEEFVLKAQCVDLFRHMDELRDGAIDVLTIKNGLPFQMAREVTIA